jgi:DNA-dependent RNA polymerase auxiliary subunit epsilon
VRQKSDILFLHLPTSFIVSQNPQVEGVNQHRYIFDSKVPSPACPSYLARYYSDSGSVLLNAGTAHGVTIGAEFAYAPHEGSHASGKPLLTFTVNNSASFFSTLRPAIDPSSQSLPGVFTVFQAKPGLGSTIDLYLPADHNSTSLMSVRQDIQRLPHNIEFVDSPDDAHLELTVRDNQVVVSVRDRKATVYGFDHKFQTTQHNLTSFLEKAACFYRERNLHTSIDSEVAKNVTLGFYRLGPTRSKFEDIPECQLGASGPNLYSGDTIDVIIEEGCFYGVKLTNLSSDDLYPTLFYLDNSDFSISDVYHFLRNSRTNQYSPVGTCYEPPFSGSSTPEAPLKSDGGTLTIGYGSGGMPSFSYAVPARQNIGFLKLLVSTRPIHSTAGKWPCLCRLESDGSFTLDGGEYWGTLMIPMIQRRVSSVLPSTFAHLAP